MSSTRDRSEVSEQEHHEEGQKKYDEDELQRRDEELEENDNKSSSSFEECRSSLTTSPTIPSEEASKKSSNIPSNWAKCWTEEEDHRLFNAIHQYGNDWKKITEAVGTRDQVKCIQRWEKGLRPDIIKGRWRDEEDRMLVFLVSQGLKNWREVANKMPRRTSKQCRERWNNYLDPALLRTPFTQQEDEILLRKHQEMGNKWASIARHIPGRTENAVKLRYHLLLKKKGGDEEVCNLVEKIETKEKRKIEDDSSQDLKWSRGEEAALLKNIKKTYNGSKNAQAMSERALQLRNLASSSSSYPISLPQREINNQPTTQSSSSSNQQVIDLKHFAQFEALAANDLLSKQAFFLNNQRLPNILPFTMMNNRPALALALPQLTAQPSNQDIQPRLSSDPVLASTQLQMLHRNFEYQAQPAIQLLNQQLQHQQQLLGQLPLQQQLIHNTNLSSTRNPFLPFSLPASYFQPPQAITSTTNNNNSKDNNTSTNNFLSGAGFSATNKKTY